MDIALHLANGEQIDLVDFQLPLHAVVICPDIASLNSIYLKLTDANLSQVYITQDSDVIQRWNGVMWDGFQAVINGDRTITAHFYFSGIAEISEPNDDYVTAAKILLGEEE